MNHRMLLLVLAAGVLASCGKQPTSRVQFVNFTPHSELEKDYRSIRAFCPKCNAPVDATLDQCPKTFSSGENCEFQLIYDDEYTCAFCNGKKTSARRSRAPDARGRRSARRARASRRAITARAKEPFRATSSGRRR